MAKDFSGFSGPGGAPTAAERRLIAACAAGGEADCHHLDDAEKQVSAELIVALGTGQFRHNQWPDWQLHDRGLWLAGAIIRERLRADERAFPGSLLFIGCRFEKAVDFTNASIDGQLRFNGCTLTGRSDFADAEITGQFSANGATFTNPNGTGGFGDAIIAQGVKAASWFMQGARVEGAFNIVQAEITGAFEANGATFTNPNGTGGFGRAIFAQGVKAADWFMNGARVEGAFNIAGAEITGQFSANAATFTNPAGNGGFGDAIIAHGVKAAGWFMNGARVEGAFNIAGAEITGQFSARAEGRQCAEFINPGGIAILFDYARISGGIWLARGDGSGGTRVSGRLQLNHARIGARLQLAGVALDCGTSEGHKAVSAIMARIEGRLVMPNAPVTGIIDLSRAHCDTLEDNQKGWPKALERGCETCGRESRTVTTTGKDGREEGREVDIQHLVLDGFTYDHIEVPDGGTGEKPGPARIRWLSGQSARALKTEFDPQPWRQCAKTLREMGYDEAAQQISIERRVRERFADGTRLLARAVSWFLHVVADYGFNPWKGVGWSGAVIAVCAGLYAYGDFACPGSKGGLDTARGNACGGHPAYVQTKYADFEGKEGEGKRGYPAFNAVLFSLDHFVPLLDLGTDPYWRANTKAVLRLQTPLLEIGEGADALRRGTRLPIGWLLYLLTVFETIFGSILLAIVITGFTGLLTRDEK